MEAMMNIPSYVEAGDGEADAWLERAGARVGLKLRFDPRDVEAAGGRGAAPGDETVEAASRAVAAFARTVIALAVGAGKSAQPEIRRQMIVACGDRAGAPPCRYGAIVRELTDRIEEFQGFAGCLEADLKARGEGGQAHTPPPTDVNKLAKRS